MFFGNKLVVLPVTPSTGESTTVGPSIRRFNAKNAPSFFEAIRAITRTIVLAAGAIAGGFRLTPCQLPVEAERLQREYLVHVVSLFTVDRSAPHSGGSRARIESRQVALTVQWMRGPTGRWR